MGWQVQAGPFCVTHGVFQQVLVFVGRLKGQGETHLLLHTMACFWVNQRGMVFLSGQDYCLSAGLRNLWCTEDGGPVPSCERHHVITSDLCQSQTPMFKANH